MLGIDEEFTRIADMVSDTVSSDACLNPVMLGRG